MATDRHEGLIELDGVEKWFDREVGVMDRIMRRDPQPVKAVDGVTLEINEGDVMGIAGESGCGKTTLGKLLVKLHEPTAGSIRFDDMELTDLAVDDQREFRRRVQMIFQDPFESLNPGMTVHQSVAEPLKVNDLGEDYYDRREQVIEVLNDVGLSPAEAYMDAFPRELSGGERQRVAIARALVVDPDFIVADEPVSMLDVSIRAGVLNLMKELQDKYGLTYLFISHDLSLLRYMCDRLAVMYLGNVIEQGDTAEIVRDPKHPYTEALFDAVPKVEKYDELQRANVSGEVPSPRNPPTGCRFHPRCPEIIPPDDWTGSQDAYRRLASFRHQVKKQAIGPEDLDGEDPEEPLQALLDIGLALDIPEEFQAQYDRTGTNVMTEMDAGEGVKQSLRDAGESVLAEDYEAALEELDEYPTVCEHEEPEITEVGDRLVACHLHDDRY